MSGDFGGVFCRSLWDLFYTFKLGFCHLSINKGFFSFWDLILINFFINVLFGVVGNVWEFISKRSGVRIRFVLTPKLLNGLEFNERVTVHVVHNGPAIENPLDWDPQRLLRR
ncbi:unnamed protein product [Meloidogyne enterolobii]|uniref:Uncharacterized protein n=1 Tax=Meloidogyne enterolobii TaxID=390850 RepID=A0ACB1A3F4_MELEN